LPCSDVFVITVCRSVALLSWGYVFLPFSTELNCTNWRLSNFQWTVVFMNLTTYNNFSSLEACRRTTNYCYYHKDYYLYFYRKLSLRNMVSYYSFVMFSMLLLCMCENWRVWYYFWDILAMQKWFDLYLASTYCVVVVFCDSEDWHVCFQPFAQSAHYQLWVLTYLCYVQFEIFYGVLRFSYHY